MYSSSHDLKRFYNGKTGRVARRVIKQHLGEMWPDVNGLSLVGMGYSLPYLPAYEDGAERLCALMSAEIGVHHWPSGANKTVLIESNSIPLEASSVDRVLAIHHLEYTDNIKHSLEEVWRILKPGGRMIIVVPNRLGLWARADWSPFGHGAPFNLSQIIYYLRDSRFEIERTEEALLMPPSRWSIILRMADFFERFGRKCLPICAGVHVIEVTKQVYARPTTVSRPRRKMLPTKGLFPAPSSRTLAE